MSELKRLLTALKTGNPYSEDAIIKLFEKSWQDNSDFCAKLAAKEQENKLLQKENLDILNDRPCNRKTIKFMHIDFDKKLDEIKQERDEAREGWQDYILRHANLQDHVGKLENEIEELEQERDNLQQELLELKAERESDRQECHACSKHKDNLQAANGVLRGALQHARKYIGQQYPMTLDRIDQALSTTPAEVGERVRELVTALETVVQSVNRHAITPAYRLLPHAVYDIAKDSLAKYKGE